MWRVCSLIYAATAPWSILRWGINRFEDFTYLFSPEIALRINDYQEKAGQVNLKRYYFLTS
jgi:hypothetical protein